MSKHTPGPWWIAPRENGFIDVCHKQGAVKGAITLALCRVQARQSWISEAEANARLIAAAPDLLEALDHCIDWFEASGYEVPAMKMAQAAYIKATGEQS